MQLTAKIIILLSVGVALLVGALASLWELYLESALGFGQADEFETLSHKLEFIVVNIIFSSLALIVPVSIAIHIQKKHAQFETEAKESDVRAKHAHDRFQDFSESSSDWFWETDENGLFTYISNRFFDSLEISDKTMYLGKPRIGLGPAGVDPDLWQQHVDDVKNRRPFKNFLRRYILKNGKPIWYAVNGIPVYAPDGRFLGYRGTGRDVTHEKESELAILESEQRFRDFTESASDWFWEMGSDLRFTYISERFFDLTGISPDEMIGKTRAEFAGMKDVEESPEKWEKHQHDMETHKPFRDFTYKRLRPDGTPQYMSISGKPVFDEHGAFQCYRGTGRDVTEVQRVREDLIHAKNEAENANRAKSDFLASMSHELRTPMNAIIGFTEMITHSTAEPPSEKNREYLSYILSSANHLMGLINQVLELARIESGEVAINPTSVSFKKTMEDTIALLHGTANKSNVTIIPDCGCGGDTKVWADPLRLKQVFFNLISNAIKYNRAGGTVKISCGEETNDAVKIIVQDTGIGIPANKAKDLFQPFNRLGLEARNIEGTGIGLTITKDLVARMNGDIGFESVEGEGSTFWIILPTKDVLHDLPDPPARADA